MKKMTKLVVVTLCIVGILISTTKIHVKAASNNLWNEANICLEQKEYRTIGITITRCELGTQTPIEKDSFTILYKNKDTNKSAFM